ANVSLLPCGELPQQSQRRLVGERVQRRQLDAHGGEQRRLGYPVRELTVLGGRAGGGELVEELGQLATRRVGVLARMAQLVEPAADLRDGAGVVVEVVSQQVLALDLRLEREP